MRLTTRYVDSVQHEGGGTSRDVRWDEDPRGFGLRTYPSGKKAFVLSYRARGLKRIIALGPYGTLTANKARGLVHTKLAEVYEGGDPLAKRQSENSVQMFSAPATPYLDRHARIHKSPNSVREDERIIARELLPKWGGRRITDIRRRDVIGLLDMITTASRDVCFWTVSGHAEHTAERLLLTVDSTDRGNTLP